jgi:hypothetical protein
MEEILSKRQLDQYNFQMMSPEEQQEIWDQEQLNELQGNLTPRGYGLPLDNLEQYAQFLQDQLQQDIRDQTRQIYDMQNNEYTEQCRRNGELLMQKEEWEDMAFRLQQLH